MTSAALIARRLVQRSLLADGSIWHIGIHMQQHMCRFSILNVEADMVM